MKFQLQHQSFWIFIGRTYAEAEALILWLPDAKSWLIWKGPDAGENWRQEERERQRMICLDGITDSMDMVWVDSRSWWWTGRPGVLRFMGSQGVGHDWAIELNWTQHTGSNLHFEIFSPSKRHVPWGQEFWLNCFWGFVHYGIPEPK